MELYIDPALRRGVSRVLFEQIRDAVVSGRVAQGDRLPPSREIAGQLGISRHTVTTVYGRLVAEGYLEGRAGGGTFVATTAPAAGSATAQRRRRDGRPPSPLRPAGVVTHNARSAEPPPPGGFDLRIGLPDPALFPLRRWKQSVGSTLHTPPAGDPDPAGIPALRRSLARWVGRSRGVETTGEQVMVVTGAQQAVDLIARVVLRPGDQVAIEEPGYHPVRNLLTALGMRVVPVPVDHDGLVVEAIPPRVRAVYTTPSHQSPTGAALALSRRRALLAFADRHDAVVIEDDYDSEHRHSDRPLEPLHRLDEHGRVIYVGTFSKTLSGALRLAFVVWPEPLVEAAVSWRDLMDGRPTAGVQQALHRFITDGFLEQHLRRVRKIYRERHGIVAGWVEECAARGLLVAGPANHAGLHVAASLPGGVVEATVRDLARRRGVALTEYAPYCTSPPERDGLLIGYGLAAADALPAALGVVGDVLAAARAAA